MADKAGVMVGALVKLVSGERVPRHLWAWALGPGASDNHDLVSNADELLDAVLANDRPRQLRQGAWWREWLLQDFLRREFGRIYPHWHYFPLYVVYSWAYATGLDPELIDQARAWFKKLFGLLVIAAAAGPGREIVDHHLERRNKPGGFVLIGNGGLVEYGPFVAWPGARSWSWLRAVETTTPANLGRFHHLDRHAGLCAPLIQVGATGGGLPTWPWEAKLWSALRRRWPNVPAWGLSPEEAGLVKRALAGDQQALMMVAKWAEGGPSIRYPFVFERREAGVLGIALALPPSSTGRCGIVTHETATDVTRFASADNGGRDTGSGDTDVDSIHRAEILPGGSMGRCWRDDMLGGSVECPLPGGKTLVRLEATGEGERVTFPEWEPVEDPAPGPPPTPPGPPQPPPPPAPGPPDSAPFRAQLRYIGGGEYLIEAAGGEELVLREIHGDPPLWPRRWILERQGD